MLFWRYCKDMQTLYFGYFGHAWLDTPKIIVSTCTRLQCLSACHKYTLLFTSFLRYYILKNPAIRLAYSVLACNLRTRVLPDMGLLIKYQQQYQFPILDYFQEKLLAKFFKKFKKPYFGAILGPFYANLGKIDFLGKIENGLCQFSDIPIIYHHAKNQKKLLSHF